MNAPSNPDDPKQKWNLIAGTTMTKTSSAPMEAGTRTTGSSKPSGKSKKSRRRRRR